MNFLPLLRLRGEKPQAMGGAHDDYVMALGIALMCKEEKGMVSNGKIIRLPAFA